MRTHTIALAGQDYDLAVSFGAGDAIAKAYGDPFTISREIALTLTVPGHEPKWVPTVQNVPAILHIGMKEAGSKLTLDQVKALCYDAGLANARNELVQYLTAFMVTGEETADEGESSGE